MSATDELRRMLDERGVEWTKPNSCLRDEVTLWAAGGFDYEAFEVPEPADTFLLAATNQADLTPEQAIAATLGAGTCRWEYPQGVNGWVGYAVCSSCGERFDECVTDTAHYCPNCGRKVEG